MTKFIWTKIDYQTELVTIYWFSFMPYMLKPYFAKHPEVTRIIGDALPMTGNPKRRFLSFEMVNGEVEQSGPDAALNTDAKLISIANSVLVAHPEVQAMTPMLDDALNKVLTSV